MSPVTAEYHNDIEHKNLQDQIENRQSEFGEVFSDQGDSGSCVQTILEKQLGS
jgi:hypothetical protein